MVRNRKNSGTCNVCSAPCSSCLHVNRGSTTVKAEESTGENCQDNVASQYSATDVPVKISGQNETGNAVTDGDVYDDKSKAGLRVCDVSRTSDDGETPPTSSPGGTGERIVDKREGNDKYEERKDEDGRKKKESLEDEISCVTGGNGANKLASSENKCSEEFSSTKNELIENSCSQDEKEGVRSPKLQSTLINSSSGKSSLSSDVNSLKDKSTPVTEEAPGSGSSKLQSTLPDSSSGKPISCSPDVNNLKDKSGTKEHSTSVTEEASDLGPGQGTKDHCANSESHSVASEKVGSELNPETKSIKEIENLEPCKLPNVQSNIESQPMIDSDESDVFEQDVKVCDICGDAGREDKLAICSRCSDGAEHIYCMLKMIDKVPEGDWLCEECKSSDEIKAKDVVLPVAEDADLILNEGEKYIDAEATKTRKTLLGKRERDATYIEEIEIPPEAKKQALGSALGSQKTPRGVTSLSRDLSKRNLGKGEWRLRNQLSSPKCSHNETLEDETSPRKPRQQTTRSTLLKSNSFSTNVKSKVDFFDEIRQKQKSAIEPGYVDKEGASKLIGRSMSLKPTTSSRLNTSESKVKMLSSKFSHPQDVKGLRQTKAHSMLEKKSLLKPERLVNTTRSSSTLSIPSADQKVIIADSIVSNDSELKGVPSDSKPSTLSKSASCKGEIKVSVSNQKPKESGKNVDSLTATHTTEKAFRSSRGDFPGVLPRPQESENLGERVSSANRSRTSLDSPRAIVNVASSTRSSADIIKGNKLKAAIEAAMLKKPGICRKNKPADQADDVSISYTNLNSKTCPENDLATSRKRENMCSANETHGKWDASTKQNQSSLPCRGNSSKIGGHCPVVPSGLSNQQSATPSIVSKMPVLPEHEYVWQGDFDIHKIGKLAVLRDGLQAHVSTCASPKVLEVVTKFPSKFLLHEVGRLSIWPVQFQEAGAKEDNIALYFFAKDLECYERNYKSLIETMMKRDVALQGKLDGVELFIFPSNHLPQNAQRWNTLYYLWGVFKRKKANLVPKVPDSNSFKHPTTVDIPAIFRNVNANSNGSDNVKGLPDTKVSSGYSDGQCLRGNVEKQDHSVDAKRISNIPVPEAKSTTIALEGKADFQTQMKSYATKLQPSGQDITTNFSNTQHSPSCSGSSAKASLSGDPETLERAVKEKEGSTDASMFGEGHTMVHQATKESKNCEFGHVKRLRDDLILEAPNASICLNLASTTLLGGASTYKKQKIDSSLTDSVDNNMLPEIVSDVGHALKEEARAPKRGIALDLNETQDFAPDSPSPEIKQAKGCLFDLNVAQNYPDNDENGDGSSLSLFSPSK